MKAKRTIRLLCFFALIALTGLLFAGESIAATIEGTVFTDMNGNDVMDPCEPPLQDKAIRIRHQSWDVSTIIPTSENGKYSFTSSETGIFELTIEIPFGQKLTKPVQSESGWVTYQQTVNSADESFTVDFCVANLFGPLPNDNLPTVTLSHPLTTEVNTEVEFTATFHDDDGHEECPDSPAWDFGDGNRINGVNDVKHVYAKAGTYTVKVTVVDTFFGVGKAQGTLTVTAPPSPKMQVSKTEIDFGNNVVRRKKYQRITISNVGDAPLKLGNVKVKGTQSSDFGTYRTCSERTIAPNGSCQMYTYFQPTSSGQKSANLEIPSNEPDSRKRDGSTKSISLDGTADSSPPDGSGSEKACSLPPTIKAVEEKGKWDEPGTWMVKDDTGNWVVSDRIPDKDDVVSISKDATVVGSHSVVTIKALCNRGTLVSDQNGFHKPYSLEIYATDSISNSGEIKGADGPTDTSYCGVSGGDVILISGEQVKRHDKAGNWWWYSYQSGGPIYNKGRIMGGNGGMSYLASCPSGKGGNAIVLGCNTANTGTGMIKAGTGGLSAGGGTGGEGGLTQIWGKLGGRGYLINTGEITGGDGGKGSKGGKGGNLWLVSLPDVHLNGGTHRSGNGGEGTPNGKKGWVRIEPNSISITDAVIDGENVSIYGGNDWTLDLNTMNSTITSTENITLAVGDGGVVDLTGNTETILSANKVSIFSDAVVLDDGVSLEDVIDANEISTAPAKILKDVSLTGVSMVQGNPGDKVSVFVKLANNGPEKDTYALSATSAGGSTISQLPPTVEVDGLELIELVLDVTLPDTEDATDTITVMATSQADSAVTATMEIKVFAESEEKVDVWVADPAPDAGVEPNTVSTRIWRSPDVWVRNQDDGVERYQNVKYGQDNYVYVRVRNIGNLTATDTKVEVYRVDASLGRGWPNGWRKVGETNIATIEPDANEIVTIRWDKEEIPKPGHYCFYVRVENADDPITFEEGNNPVRNTFNNNNIAWRNFNVVGLLDKVSDKFDVDVGNPEDQAKNVDIVFEDIDGLLGNDGVRVILDLRNLFQRWKDAGAKGENVNILEGTEVQLVGSAAKFFDIPMSANEVQTIQMRTDVFKPMPVAGESKEYHFSAQEYLDSELIGGVDYIIITRAQGTDTDNDGIPDITDPDDDNDGVTDDDEITDGTNPLIPDALDCNGDPNGTAFLDNCGECVGGNTGKTACVQDCNNEWGGTASTDQCGECVGGSTGKTACTQDCNKEWGGTASTDECGECVGGTTGKTACTQDCNNEWGGSASTDQCGECVAGSTGKTACTQDCNNEWGGSASTDQCGECVGGITGKTACIQDCNNEWGGSASTDECGECVGGTTGKIACTQDCNNEWGGTASTDECGECVGGTTGKTACTQDCNNEWGGTAYTDECGECVGGTTGKVACEDPDPPEVCESALDVLIVLDISNSMNWDYVGSGTRYEAARLAIQSMNTELTKLGGDHRAALITFAQPVETGKTVVQVRSGFTSDFASIDQILEETEPVSSYTPTALGLEGALNFLVENSDSDHLPVVVLLTDGVPNVDRSDNTYTNYRQDMKVIRLQDTEGDFLTSAEVAQMGDAYTPFGTRGGQPMADAMDMVFLMKFNEIVIYSVAIQGTDGSKPESESYFREDLLEYAAYETSGTSYSAENAQELVAKLMQILEDSTCEPPEPSDITCADDTGAIDIVSTDGKYGETVSIPVRIQDAPNAVNNLTFEVVFDTSMLTYKSVSKGKLTDDFTSFQVSEVSPGVIRAGGSVNGIEAGASDDLLYLEFDVATTESGTSELELRNLKDDIRSWTATPGCFSQVCDGDVNGDGEFTPQDALYVFEKYMGNCPTSGGIPCEDICGDVNYDLKITPADALCIFYKYLGSPSCLD